MESLFGKLLVAIPDLPDSNFYRSVVLILQHTKEGATGVILNRPSNVTVATVWDEISSEECDSEVTVNVGGPCEGPLMALHQSLAAGEEPIIGGVFVSIQRENLNKIVNQTKHPFKIYSGYAGWGPGQLESEIKVGGWLVTDATAANVFEPSEDLWKNVCAHVGHEIMLPHFNVNRVPTDPSSN